MIQRHEDEMHHVTSAGTRTWKRVVFSAGAARPRALAWADEESEGLWMPYRWSSKFGPVPLGDGPVFKAEAEARALDWCERNAGRKQGPIGRARIERPHPRAAREHAST